MTLIQDHARVLFQGDSITDAGRLSSGNDWGAGYMMMAAARFSAFYPEKGVEFVNRGISGNRVRDLRERWRADCLALAPDWLSILIGVNDTWRRYDRGDSTSTDAFAQDYRAILEQTVSALPSVRLVLCEPFLLPVPQDRTEWRVDLDPKIAVVRALAIEYQALYVPLDGIFAAAATRRAPEFWCPDGVHPTPAGHALIADAWLRTVRA